MSIRGYYGDPPHDVKKRQYVDCANCGERTWAKNGVCTACDYEKYVKKLEGIQWRRTVGKLRTGR